MLKIVTATEYFCIVTITSQQVLFPPWHDSDTDNWHSCIFVAVWRCCVVWYNVVYFNYNSFYDILINNADKNIYKHSHLTLPLILKMEAPWQQQETPLFYDLCRLCLQDNAGADTFNFICESLRDDIFTFTGLKVNFVPLMLC